MKAAESLPEPGTAFIKNEDNTFGRGEIAYFMEKVVLWSAISGNFHLYRPDIVLTDDSFEFIKPIIAEWQNCPLKMLGNAIRLQARQKVISQITFVAQVGREIPVVPAMVPADCDLVLACGGTSNTNCDGVRFATGPGKATHFRPGVQLDQTFR